MRVFGKEAILLLSAFALLTGPSGAQAQSHSGQSQPSGGFVQGIKDMFADPNLRNFVGNQLQRRLPGMSAGALPSGGSAPYGHINGMGAPGSGPGSYGSGANANSPGFGRFAGSGPSTYKNSDDSSAGGYPAGSASNAPVVFSKKLAPAELNRLSQYDISILVDSSASMGTSDCPSILPYQRDLISRWQWCQEQTSFFTQQLASVMPNGITLVPFSSKFQRIEHVSARGIGAYFASVRPDGGTNLENPLRAEIENYFSRRDAGQRTRPLLLTVISDGDPSNKSAVRKLIKETTARMHRPDEIRIVFLLIGTDRSGHDFVHELDNLDNGMLSRDVAFDIVSSHQFDELNQAGLGRSLAQALR